MSISAGYNADLARTYGLTEALLLENIEYYTRASRRKDGYCWFTANEFELRTAIKSGAMTRAIKNLESQGIIEVKNTYIIGTQKKCRHFRIASELTLTYTELEQSQSAEVITSDCAETIQSESTETAISVNNLDGTNTELKRTAIAVGEKPKEYGNPDINEMFSYWQEMIGYPITAKRQKNRQSCSNLLKTYKKVGVKKLINTVAAAHHDKYAPGISDFIELQANLNRLSQWAKRQVTDNVQEIF